MKQASLSGQRKHVSDKRAVTRPGHELDELQRGIPSVFTSSESPSLTPNPWQLDKPVHIEPERRRPMATTYRRRERLGRVEKVAPELICRLSWWARPGEDRQQIRPCWAFSREGESLRLTPLFRR